VCGLLQVLLAKIDKHDPSSFFDEELCACQADASRPTRHDADLAV
jgi:hypothetical protein